MAQLVIRALGPLQVYLDTESVTGFDSDKVRALLIYLAVEHNLPHTREKLAGLLWPDFPDQSARTNLRSALANLRQVIGDRNTQPPYLKITRQTIQFNLSSNVNLDVIEFNQLLSGEIQSHTDLEQATSLYKGSFLEGFSIPDSIAFEEWLLVNREGLKLKQCSAMLQLSEYYDKSDSYDQALVLANQLLAIDPYQESAHRKVMEILFRSGQRIEALAKYESCRKILLEELGTEPSPATQELYELINLNRPLPESNQQVMDVSRPARFTINDRFRLEAEIGHGAVGTVYSAVDQTHDRLVAIKVIRTSMLRVQFRLQWLQEAREIKKLNHPNIAKIYETGVSDSNLFMVMELVTGGTLSQLKRDADPRLDQLEVILTIARQVCAALEHAHNTGIIHRDLKPENILFAQDGTVRLVGFGLTRSMAIRLSSEESIIGSVFYTAPELAVGQEYDQRADLYSLGVILYELTTGQLPFSGDEPMAVISQHLHTPVVPPRARNAQVPPALDNLILRLLSKDPNERPASTSEVLACLDAPEILDREALPLEELSVLKRIDRGSLIGRKQELQEARSLWNKTLSGQGQVLLISGEAGIGKTRLVREIVTRAEVLGGWALTGNSYPEGSTPFAPFRQIVREVYRSKAQEIMDDGFSLPEFVFADLLTLAPELRSIFPESPSTIIKSSQISSSAGPQAEQQRLFEGLTFFFTTISRHAPLLLVLEDTQWSDSGSLQLLIQLARNTYQERVMLVITYRTEELEEATLLQKALHEIDRGRSATRLSLKPLERAETHQLLSFLLAAEMEEDISEEIYQQTEGNPFFIEEVCKALVESGKLYYADGSWQHTSLAEFDIPQSIRTTINTRVGVLPENSQEVLRQAAVLGREFDFNTLALACEQSEEGLIEALDDAERAQLIEITSHEHGGTFSFAHTLITSTLVENLRALPRRQKHLKAAIALKQHHPEDYESLAYHYDQAGRSVQAADYLLSAGDRARSLYAHQEAINNYQSALETLKSTHDLELSARTLMKLGLTYNNAFNFEASRQAYQEGFVYWQRVAEVEPLLQIAPHPLRVTIVEPGGLIPGVAMDHPSAIIHDQLYSGLLELSPDMNVVPNAALHWEVLEGGSKYIFHLRDDLCWSDEVPVTAKDYEYGWKHALDPARQWQAAPLLYDIKNAKPFNLGQLDNPNELGVRAIDDLTLVVDLEGPTSYFPYVAAFSPTFPIPRHVIKQHGKTWTDPTNLATNGPFKLLSWSPGESLILERNPHYHGRFSGNLESVECRILADKPSQYLQLYAQDQLDICSDLPPVEMNRAQLQFAGEYQSGPKLSIDFIGFDLSKAPFNDRNVRRALVLATDRETLAHVSLRGLSFPATGGLIPPGMPGHSPNIGLPYDPQAARQLLEEAGYPGGRGFPEILGLARDDPGHELQYEYLASQWSHNLGIKVNWQKVEWAQFADQLVNEKPHLWLVGWWSDYPDPDDFLRVQWWFSPSWQQKDYLELIMRAQRAMNQKERMQMYQQADQILIDEAPLLPLAYLRFHMLVKPWVKKNRTSPLRWWFWKDIILEQH